MVRRLCLLLIFIVPMTTLAQQDSLNVKFNLVLESEPLVLDRNGLGNELTITHFRCYLSKFEFVENEQLVWTESDSFHLLDAEDPSSLELHFLPPADISYDHIRFQIGIDSLTSVSGAYGGDLDPTRGMYWTWNNGYIHIKVEGRHPASPSREQAFEFHLGGYQGPYATVRQVSLPCRVDSALSINIDLDSFFNELDLRRVHAIMSPGQEAFELSRKFADSFSIEYGQ